MKRLIAFSVCFILVAFSLNLTACDSASGPEKALEAFEEAFNTRDFEGVLKIYTPELQAEYKMKMQYLEGMAGLAGIGSFVSEDMFSAVFGSALGDSYIDIEVLDEEYSADKKSATVTVQIGMDGTFEVDELEMICISDSWYVESDSFGIME